MEALALCSLFSFESVLVVVLVCGSRVVVRLVNSQTRERLELSVAVFTWKQGPLQQQMIQSIVHC